MRVPISWLKEYVDINLPLKELAERLTLAGLEVEAIESIGLPGAPLPWEPRKIVVAEVVEIKPHPAADRLVLAVVDYGGSEFETVVTGAPNLYPYVGKSGLRLKVAFAMEGAELYDGHAEQPRVIRLKRTQIRGVPSRAMVCSEKELGLGDDHTGIMMLPDDAPAPGMPLVGYLGDAVLDIDLTPNLARCLSVLGVAREVAALTGTRVRLPDTSMAATGAPAAQQVEIAIEDPDLCNRYSATIIRDVHIGPSPFWMQRRLTLAGMRPINNVVDVTNYVMLEMGQPLHAFDYDLLLERARRIGHQVPRIIVRRARPGEHMMTLDGVDRELTPDSLMITDMAGPIGVAGVMGGAETEISATTRNILLEAAHFDYICNRRTAQALKIPSEATTRFGRGVPASGTVPAAQRASEWMRRLAGGVIAQGVVDAYPIPQSLVTVRLPMGEVKRVLGIDIPKDEVVRILTGLEFAVQDQGDAWEVTVPQHRLDIGIPADLCEEIARVYGYDRIPTTLLNDELPPQRSNVELEAEEHLRDVLVGTGLQEVITYSLGNLETYRRLVPGGAIPSPDDYVRLANPLSPEREFMRRTLMPHMLETLRDNMRLSERMAAFEIGRVFWPQPDKLLPDEPRALCIGMTGPRLVRSWLHTSAESLDFSDLKGVVDTMIARLNLADAAFSPASHPTFHPGRSAVLSLGGLEVGVFGEVHPDVCETFGLSGKRVCLAEFLLDKLLADAGRPVRMRPVSTYPAVYEDLAVVVDQEVPAARVRDLIVQTGGALLRWVELFDVYRGEQLPVGKKSLAYALTYQADDRTLNAEAVEKLRNKIVRRLEQELGAVLRA